MLPAELLRQIVPELARRTRSGASRWTRDRPDREHYVLSLPRAKLVLRYHPSLDEADTLQLVVFGQSDDPVGQLIAKENREGKEDFETLAMLLFEIQFKENRNNIAAVANEIIHLLPEGMNDRWGRP